MFNKEEFIDLEELMQSDSLMNYLDEEKAFILGSHFSKAMEYPGFEEKYISEIDGMFKRISELKDTLSDVQKSMNPEDNLGSFIEKGIDAFQTKEDRITASFILGIYATDCVARLANE